MLDEHEQNFCLRTQFQGAQETRRAELLRDFRFLPKQDVEMRKKINNVHL